MRDTWGSLLTRSAEVILEVADVTSEALLRPDDEEVTRIVCVTGFCFRRLCGCFGWNGKKNIELPSLTISIYFSLMNALALCSLCQHIDLHIRLIPILSWGKRVCSYLCSLQPLTGAYDRTIYAYFVLVWGFSACKNVRDHQFILLAVGKFLRTKSMKKAMQTYMYLAVGNLSFSLKKQKKIGLCCQKKTRAAPLEEV